MLTISQQQALDRWDFLTPDLREALFSEVNSDFIWKLCHTEHLSDDKSLDVAEISGYVVMGFLHPEDLAGELKDALGLAPQTAKAIADGINTRIFTPLRADIDQVYQPISKLEAAPKVFQDIGPSVATKAAPGATPAPISINKINPVQPAAAPKPTTTPAPVTSAAGWSTGKTFTVSAPVVKPSAPNPIAAAPVSRPATTPAPVVKPVAPQVPPPVPAKPAAPSFSAPTSPSVVNNPFGGKFEPMGTRPAAPAAPAGPAPFILHEDTRPTSLQTSSDFRLSRPNEKGNVDMAMFQQKAAPRPAVLELGNNPAPSRPMTTPANQNIPPRYPATQNTGPRSVSEITAPPPAPAASSMPKPPTPPSPLSAPRPPMPPTPPKPGDPPRVIRQNY